MLLNSMPLDVVHYGIVHCSKSMQQHLVDEMHEHQTTIVGFIQNLEKWMLKQNHGNLSSGPLVALNILSCDTSNHVT